MWGGTDAGGGAAVPIEDLDGVAEVALEPEPAEDPLEVAVRGDDDRFVDRPAKRSPDERGDRGRAARDRPDPARHLLDVDAGERECLWHQTVLRSLVSSVAASASQPGTARIVRRRVSAEISPSGTRCGLSS